MGLFNRFKKNPADAEAEVEQPAAEQVPINDEIIRLGQFLKLANMVEHGGQAKEVIAAGDVVVNGEVEMRRGRQLRAGDIVEFNGQIATPVDAASFEDNLPW